MKKVTDIVLANCTVPEESQALTIAIDQFLTILGDRGGANWFSQVRNRVNYAHEYGAWYPYIDSTCDVNRIATCFDGWLGPPDQALLDRSPDELIEFSKACSFIISLCRITVDDLVFRSKSNSPFRSSSGRLLALTKLNSISKK